MMGSRSCGKCRACCTAIGVTEIGKLSGEACKHLCRSGCSVYQERPPSCQSYACAWFRGSFTAEQRPDRMGIVLSWQGDGAELHAHEMRSGALEQWRATLLRLSAVHGYQLVEWRYEEELGDVTTG
jgi:hypothetical protein